MGKRKTNATEELRNSCKYCIDGIDNASCKDVPDPLKLFFAKMLRTIFNYFTGKGDMLSVDEFCAVFGFGMSTFYNHVNARNISAPVKLDHSRVGIPFSEIEKLQKIIDSQ